jgi:hypothetical protein
MMIQNAFGPRRRDMPQTDEADAATRTHTGIMLQFLDWIDRRPRTYGETMDAWQSSCPRLSVWEDARIDGLVLETAAGPGQSQRAVRVVLTELGISALRARVALS